MATDLHGVAIVMLLGRYLEASYPAYCMVLRMLVQDGTSLNKIQRAVRWERLQLLHTTLPRQYRDPVVHN